MDLLFSYNSPLFYRPLYTKKKDLNYCSKNIKKIFGLFGVNSKKGKIFVGHTGPTSETYSQKYKDTGVRRACNDNLWYVDVTMSRAFDRKNLPTKERYPTVVRLDWDASKKDYNINVLTDKFGKRSVGKHEDMAKESYHKKYHKKYT